MNNLYHKIIFKVRNVVVTSRTAANSASYSPLSPTQGPDKAGRDHVSLRGHLCFLWENLSKRIWFHCLFSSLVEISCSYT